MNFEHSFFLIYLQQQILFLFIFIFAGEKIAKLNNQFPYILPKSSFIFFTIPCQYQASNQKILPLNS